MLTRFIALFLLVATAYGQQLHVEGRRRAAGGGGGDPAYLSECAMSSSATLSSCTVGSGTDRILLVGVSFYNGSGITVTGVTWNTSENLTQVGTAEDSPVTGQADLWCLANPTATTANIVASFSGSVTARVGAIVLENISGGCTATDTATDLGEGIGTVPSATVASSGADDVCVDIMWHWTTGDEGDTSGANQTDGPIYEDGNNGPDGYMSYETATGSNTVMSWTNNVDDFALVAGCFN